VIYTVFVTGVTDKDNWQADLLEFSWQQARQPGELVRLVAAPPSQALPMHGLARVVRTRPWSPHPYIPDQFDGYNYPASLLEWVIRERIDATLLVLDGQSILLESAGEDIEPGQALANTWRELPSGGDGPFSLPEAYDTLRAFCVNRKLKLPRAQFPLLIHSRDLKKIAARWLEMTGIIRRHVKAQIGWSVDPGKLAYSIAAAEYRLPHKTRKLALRTRDRKTDKAILSYREAVESAKGKIVWDSETYTAWESCAPEAAKAGAGREFLAFLQEYISLRESFGHLRLRRPRRCIGVREARILDRMLLEIPGRPEPLSLNSSAAAIWDLCDDQRSMIDIAKELEKKFSVPPEALCPDVEAAINQLHSEGAVDLEIAS
jgi:hypothetical protein